MWLQVWVCRSYLLLCVVSMIFPVNHHNFLELIFFFFFSTAVPALAFPSFGFYCWGGVTFIFCCSSLQNHVYHEKVKETTKGRKQDVSCKIVCVNLHSIVLQLERSSQSKNTVKLVYQIASLIFFFLRKRKKHGSGREWPLCGWKNNSHIGTRKNYSAAPVWARR